MKDIRKQRVNANKHTERGLKALDNSIRTDGWIGAMTVAADGETFDGSARLEAIDKSMPSAEPIIVETDGTRPVIVKRTDIPSADDPRAKRLGVAANVIAHMDYSPDGGILAMIASDDDAVMKLIKQDETSDEAVRKSINSTGDADAEPQIDRAAELNEKWQVKTGDLWRIGEHRLLCGDSTKREDVERVMQGEKADMVWTDPPYGVDYEGGSGNDTKREKLEGDDSSDLYMPALCMLKSICNAGAPMYIWFASSVGKPVFEAVGAIGYEVRAMIVWNKIDAHYGAYMAQYMQKHEPCLYIVNGNPHWIGPTNDITVWDVKQPSNNEFHPTEKPLELAMHPIRNHDARIVADFFAGSGTALVASQNLNRKCRSVEKKPSFCAVILERMATAFPGIDIERLSNGPTQD